jgi:predicted RNase H-like HicB family nuclease
MQLHAIITREDDMFVAQAIEVDIASQGYSEDEALANLREAIELVLEDGGILPSSPYAQIRELEIAA